MKHFEKKLNEFIDSIPPEFHAIHEKAEQLRKEFEIIKDMPETAISCMEFYNSLGDVQNQRREQKLLESFPNDDSRRKAFRIFFDHLEERRNSSEWVKEMTELNYERIHYESKGIKYDGSNDK
jgi:hypothetical protein